MDLTITQSRDPARLDSARMVTMEKPSLNEVYHHGIKGMKWGVRRTPEQLGHDTSQKQRKVSKKISELNKARHDFAEGWHQTRVEEYSDKYQKMGMSKAEADARSEKNYQLRKKVAYGVLAVGAAAIVGTAIYAYGKDHTDEIIKSGTTLQTLSHDPHRMEKGRQFFTNFRENDKTTYVGLFGGKGNSPKHVHTMEVKKDIKVASYASGKKAFKELMKNDPEFAKDVKDAFEGNKAHFRGYRGNWDKFNATVLPMTGSEVDKRALERAKSLRDYGKHNLEMASWWRSMNQESLARGAEQNGKDQLRRAERYERIGKYGEPGKRALDKYFDYLQSKGYSGVTDLNDTKYSTLRGRSPSIIFDKSNLGAVSTRQLTKQEIRQARNKALKNVYVRHLLEPGRTIPTSKRVRHVGYAAVYSIGIVGGAQTVGTRVTVTKRKLSKHIGTEKSKAKARYVANYQREHPNTSLTYKEIETLYEQEQS